MTIEKILKALANKRRLKILKHLDTNGMSTVSEISRSIRLSMKSTSKHMQILASTDLVARDQKGLYVVYELVSILPNFVNEVLKEI